MISRENNNSKESLNLLIYEYLFKNDYHKAAQVFKEECGVGDCKINDHTDILSTLYNCFVETVEVRSGQRINPDSLNRIEGIMMKMENEKNRYSRLRQTMNCPSPRARMDLPRMMSHPPSDPYNNQSSPVVTHNHPPHPILNEIKRIDLGVSNLILSSFCVLNNILVVYSTDSHIYFYNLATNEIECDFPISTPRPLKHMKVRETENSILLAYSADDYSIRLCKYSNMKREDLKIFEFDIPFRSFCFNTDTLFILTDQGIKSYNFMGVCTGASKPFHAVSIECLGNRLLIVDPTKIAEFNLATNNEVMIFARSRFPMLRVKNHEAFLILNDSIQVVDSKLGNVIANVKSTLPCKDVALFANTIAVCTGSDLFYASDIISVKNPIEVSYYNCLNSAGLLVVSAEGMIVLYSKAGVYE